MISNLPLLFADGYPTCLEKFTLAQLEKFVPFMVQCSLGQNNFDKCTPPPQWWPAELPFANTVEKPSGMDENRWFAMLKSMVCRCYTYHGCEFMLRFCTELSDYPTATYMFVESWDGTTSLYDKDTGRLMVTFRNENRNYDKAVETSPRRSLLPKGSTQNSSRLMVQPPAFDIYLCDNCDGEFNSLREVQEHERKCNKRLQDQDQEQEQDQEQAGAGLDLCPDDPPEQPSQDNFLSYFGLYPVDGEVKPERNSPIKQTNCRRRYPAGVTFTRCCNVPFSSPLGKFIQQKSRMAAVKHQVLIDRVERYCGTKGSSFPARPGDRDAELKTPDAAEWPRTWKPPQSKKNQDTWTHHYCFTRREMCERLAARSSGGLNWGSRRLLSMCKEVRIVLTRLTEEEINLYTTRPPTPEISPRECQTFQFPTLLPNTMYTYRTNVNRTGYAQSIEILENPTMNLSPDPTIPLIDLCSTDEEDEGMQSEVPLSVVPCPDSTCPVTEDKCYEQSHQGIEEDEQVFCDSNNSHNMTVYPFNGSSSYSYAHVQTPSCQDGVMEYANGFSSIPRWQMKVCINSPPSPSYAPSFAHQEEEVGEEDEEIMLVEPNDYGSVDIHNSKVSSFQRKGTIHMSGYNRSQTENLQVFEHEMETEIYTPVLHYSTSNNTKLHGIQNSSQNTQVQTVADLQMSTSTCELATLPCNGMENISSGISEKSFSQRKSLLQSRDFSDISITSLESPDSCDVEIVESPKSNQSKMPTLYQRREQETKLLGTPCLQNRGMDRDILGVVPGTPTPVFTNFDNVALEDTLKVPVTNSSTNSHLRRRDRIQRKLQNSTPLSTPSMPTLQRVPNNEACTSVRYEILNPAHSHSTLTLEKSGVLTSMPLPPPLKPYAQHGSGTSFAPFNYNSFHDLNSHHPKEVEVSRGEDKRQLTIERPLEEVEIILDDDDDDDDDNDEPGRKKPRMEVYEDVPIMEAPTQDTSNNDVFGMSVKHEKATHSHQRCLAKSKLPLSIRRLHRDDCRELKRRGLRNIMNKGGRVLRRQSEENDSHLVEFADVKIKKELVKDGKLPRMGKIVTLTLLDNEVELICSNSSETGLCNVENKELYTSSSCKFDDLDLKFNMYNIKCRSRKEKCTDQIVSNTASTHTCPSVKVESDIKLSMDIYSSNFSPSGLGENVSSLSSEQKCSLESWKYLDYSSPIMMPSVNPEQALEHSKISNSEIYPIKTEAKCLRKNIANIKYLKSDFPAKKNVKIDKNDFNVSKKKNNFFSTSNLFQSNGQHCFRRKKLDSEENSTNLNKPKECMPRCNASKAGKEIESCKVLQRQNHSKYPSRNSQNFAETYRRNLRGSPLILENHICKIQCKKY